jgi:ketosteroid isomerase-like protein
MKTTLYLFAFLLFTQLASAQIQPPTAADRLALARTTQAIRDAFARGDVDAIVALHHPDVIKYFGGKNVVTGRAELRKGLIATFKNVRMEFAGNKVESTVFNGSTAIETSIFTFRVIPKNGGESTLSRGRSMVVYVRYKDSPTGWASIREMAQAAP